MKFKWRHVFIAFGLIILVIMVVDFNRRIGELNRLTTQLDSVNHVATEVMQTQVALVTSVAYASSTQAVEDWAYRDGHWVRNDEKPIALIPAGNVTSTATPPPPRTTQELPNWQIWWGLFFGDQNK
jgi:hypothetical protein